MQDAAKSLQDASQILKLYENYWRFNAFHQNPLSVQHLLPAIEPLNEEDLWQLDNDPDEQAAFFEPFFPELFKWLKATEPQLLATQDDPFPFWLKAGIGGNKWQQITQFISQLPKVPEAIEWCAGKGHLGQSYSWLFDAQVYSLEWQSNLCQEGQRLAKKNKLHQQFIQADVFTCPIDEQTLNNPETGQLWLSLHACGDLHRQFVLNAALSNARHIALSPCCYHRQKAAVYAPLSSAGKLHNVNLDNQDLRLAQQNQMTASRSERARRRTHLNWRLGYLALLEHEHPTFKIPHLPSIKSNAFSTFKDFCVWASEHHKVELKISTNFQAFEIEGETRRIQMMRLDALRHCFRRPLELWLLLDKALFLQELGYHTQWAQFCTPQISPRNLLLQAWK